MNNLIESSPNKTFFEFLLTYQNKKAADFVIQCLLENPERKGYIMMNFWLNVSGYQNSQTVNQPNIDFKKDFAAELNELGILTDSLISELKQYEHAVQFTDYLKKLLLESSSCLENSSLTNKSKVDEKTWNTIACLRDWSLYLAIYFEDKKLYEKELEMRMLRCRITTTYHNNYYHLVGPDMIGVAKNFEKLIQNEKALNFYNAVRTDFYPLYEKMNVNFLKNIEYKLALWAFSESLKGIMRISDSAKNSEYELIINEIENYLN